MTQIDVLPDDVLLLIFGFYLDGRIWYGGIEAWQSLVHVCRRWRSLVFQSPRGLNLLLHCTPETPVKDKLDHVLPALPLVIEGDMVLMELFSGTDNVVAALGKTNRVYKVDLYLVRWQLEDVLSAMQVLFPELTDLRLSLHSSELTFGRSPVIPDAFLGGSAPCLRILHLTRISFPGLPKLLLSAAHLVELHLCHTEYISPEAIAASLSVLSSLESLKLIFKCDDYPRHRSSLPPSKRSTLPALVKFHFEGAIQYVEELVSRIETPQLIEMHITFLDLDQIHSGCPRLSQFINCLPTLRERDEAHVRFCKVAVELRLGYRSFKSPLDDLQINITCRGSDQLLSSIGIFNSSLHPPSTVEDLYIENRQLGENDAIENDLLLKILLPFTAVKNLYLFKEFVPCIVATLQELVGDRITEVLPSLQNILVERFEPSASFQGTIGQFFAMRQLLGCPIAVSVWSRS